MDTLHILSLVPGISRLQNSCPSDNDRRVANTAIVVSNEETLGDDSGARRPLVLPAVSVAWPGLSLESESELSTTPNKLSSESESESSKSAKLVPSPRLLALCRCFAIESDLESPMFLTVGCRFAVDTVAAALGFACVLTRISTSRAPFTNA